MTGEDRFSNGGSQAPQEEALPSHSGSDEKNTHRESANSQIMAFARTSDPAADSEQEEILRDVLRKVEFGCPVGSKDEMAEVHRLAQMYWILHHNPLEWLEKYEGPHSLDIYISLTRRCTNGCYHCSSDARGNPGHTSVPLHVLEGALREMEPFTRVLYISCEGDPFDHPDLAGVMQFICETGFPQVSLQSMVVRASKLHVFENILDLFQRRSLQTRSSAPAGSVVFFPQISFNLYSPRTGLRPIKVEHSGPDGESSHRYARMGFPGISAMHESAVSAPNLVKEDAEAFLVLTGNLVTLPSPEDFDAWFQQQTVLPLRGGSGRGWPSRCREACRRLWQFLNETMAMVVSCASRGFSPHFEIRGDSESELTSIEVVERVLDQVLNQMVREHPSLQVLRCGQCQRLHYGRSRVLIKPLGRGARLFPDGQVRADQFYDDHVKLNPEKYLCDKWTEAGAMVINTDGYPQLCYSNVALSPQIRTMQGPSLYREGFEKLRRFYQTTWQGQADYIRDNLPELVKTRPNLHYCPLFLFRDVLGQPEFQGKKDDDEEKRQEVWTQVKA